MSENMTDLKQNMALAKVCLALSKGEDAAESLTGALEWAKDDGFVLTLLDNVTAILRKIAPDGIEGVIARLRPILEKLGLDGRVSLTGVEDALRYYDAPLGGNEDMEGKVAIFERVFAGTFSGAFRAIQLDLARSCLGMLLAWRGIYAHMECVSAILDYLTGLTSEEIEELGRQNVNFLRRQAD